MNIANYLKHLRNKKGISQRKLAEKTGISSAEISKIEKGTRKKIYPEVLKMIAPALEVSYEELMEKAGYIGEDSYYLRDKDKEKNEFLSIIAQKYVTSGWSFTPTYKNPKIVGDIVLRKDYEEWHIVYISTHKSTDLTSSQQALVKRELYYLYGRLVILDNRDKTYDDYKPVTKFTIAVNNKEAFKIIKEYPPKNLTIPVSVMLLDFEKDEVVMEEELINNSY